MNEVVIAARRALIASGARLHERHHCGEFRVIPDPDGRQAPCPNPCPACNCNCDSIPLPPEPDPEPYTLF